MIHLRIDNETINDKRRFACGLGPELPAGDRYVFDSEGLDQMVDCAGCGGKPLGTPITQLSGRPATKGYEEFKRIAATWGFD